jgi:hypothetical protein
MYIKKKKKKKSFSMYLDFNASSLVLIHISVFQRPRVEIRTLNVPYVFQITQDELGLEITTDVTL